MGVYKSIEMAFTPSAHRGKLNIIHNVVLGCQHMLIMLGGVCAEYLGVLMLFWIIAVLNFITVIPLVLI